jgi:two-component sensor histidine kinase
MDPKVRVYLLATPCERRAILDALPDTQRLPPSERLLLNEFTHRVNNELAAAIGIVSTAIARAASEEARHALTRVLHCLENFARVHHLLRVPDVRTDVDACAYLRVLCGAIRASWLEENRIEVLLIERPLTIDSEQCWRLGIIVSELISNAVRHAFGSGRGRITVYARREDSAVRCSVSDNGMGMRSNPHGTGLRIVDALLRDLCGHIEQQVGGEGAAFTVVFPVAPGQE